MQQKSQDIKIVNASRIGKYSQEKNRPVCVKIANHLDVMHIMEDKKRLCDGIYVDYDYN